MCGKRAGAELALLDRRYNALLRNKKSPEPFDSGLSHALAAAANGGLAGCKVGLPP